MPLRLENLEDDKIREYMLSEFENDITEGKIYFSPRLKEGCHEIYLALMKDAIEHGDDNSLADQILSKNILKSRMPRRTPSGETTMAKVPSDAHFTLAEGEFNRFYLRALCLRAIEIGAEIEAYRAKSVRKPRPESEAMIGKMLDPKKLLLDLRINIGVDTALGLPPGPNSGLSGRINKP